MAHVSVSQHLQNRRGMSHSRTDGHWRQPLSIWLTRSVPRPGPGLGSPHGSTQASHASGQAWGLGLNHNRLT